MKFIFGFAGIASEIYDAVYKERTNICGENVSFVSTPLKSAGWFSRYSDSHANFFVKAFGEMIRRDQHNDLRDTGFATIYVKHDDVSTQRFLRALFPSTFCHPVEWTLDRTSPMALNVSKNELVIALKSAVVGVTKSVVALRKELAERDNRTPLLLPVKNFHSKCLVDEIRTLQDSLPSEEEKQAAVAQAVHAIDRRHPPQLGDYSNRRYYVDDRNVEFHPPGSARHAFARGQHGHPLTCLLSGRRRLGAPYDPVFHYDCVKGREPIRALFFGCHEDAAVKVGRPHLNIAPNDFVRD